MSRTSPLTPFELAVIEDALPWYARWLTGLAEKKGGDEARAYAERSRAAWRVHAKVVALHHEALRTEGMDP